MSDLTNYKDPPITMIQTTQNFNTITNNTNIIDKSSFPDLTTEKVANRLLKRKKNASEMGYLNFPNRSPQKINQIQDEIRINKNLERLKNEMVQKSLAVGGAVTQFKKRKQRRMIKKMMDQDLEYGVK
jgi:glutaredoxin 2